MGHSPPLPHTGWRCGRALAAVLLVDLVGQQRRSAFLGRERCCPGDGDAPNHSSLGPEDIHVVGSTKHHLDVEDVLLGGHLLVPAVTAATGEVAGSATPGGGVAKTGCSPPHRQAPRWTPRAPGKTSPLGRTALGGSAQAWAHLEPLAPTGSAGWQRKSPRRHPTMTRKRCQMRARRVAATEGTWRLNAAVSPQCESSQGRLAE